MTAPILKVDDLRLSFRGRGFRAPRLEILKGISLEIKPGETLGLVGESGSGKTTIGRAILGLIPADSGTIEFDGAVLGKRSARMRRELGKSLQVVFQDPYTSLNPALTVGDTLSEPLLGQGLGRSAGRKRVAELLDRVQLPQDAADRLPREFSGGQRQRVAIARALALRPKLIVCDEPVSALDLTTQAHVMDLLKEIQDETNVAYLFISHDLTVVRHMSHRVAVIHRGEFVEQGDIREVTENPQNPYTRKLLLAAPVPDPVRQKTRREQFDAEFGKVSA